MHFFKCSQMLFTILSTHSMYLYFVGTLINLIKYLENSPKFEGPFVYQEIVVGVQFSFFSLPENRDVR